MKKTILILLLVFMTLLAVSCNNNSNKIHVWMYEKENDMKVARQKAVIEDYCEKNSISIDIHYYKESELSFEDYVLKRNVSLSQNNCIVVGDYTQMSNLPNTHADYSKIASYDNLGDNFKSLKYIVCNYSYKKRLINKKLLDYYDIDVKSDILTMPQYRDIVFELLEKGAEFNNNVVNGLFACQLMKKYDLYLTSENTNSDIDDKYVENYQQATNEMIDRAVNREKYDIYESFNEPLIDSQTGMMLDIGEEFIHFGKDIFFTDSNRNKIVDNISDTILVFEPGTIQFGMFIGENITNDNIYKLADYLINPEFFNISHLDFGYYTFKNDIDLKLYSDITNSMMNQDDVEKYRENNKIKLSEIDIIVSQKILCGNLDKNFVDELIYSSSKVNEKIYLLLTNTALQIIQHPEYINGVDKVVEDSISQIKLAL